MSGEVVPAGSHEATPSRARQALPYAVMLVASALLYWAATRIDAYTGGGARIGPDAWPKAIIVFMALLCTWGMIQRLVARAEVPATQAAEVLDAPPAEPVPPPRDHPRKLAGGAALVVAFVLVVPWLGFFVTTALFLAIFPWIGGLRRPVLAVTLGVTGSFALVVLFMRVAYISLPLGDGPFRNLSIELLRLIGVAS